MTPRERLLSAFHKQPLDRIPVSPFIHRNFVQWFHQSRDIDIIQGTIDVYRHFGFDLMHRNFNVRIDDTLISGPQWKVEVENSAGENFVQTTTRIRTPERTLRRVVRTDHVRKYHSVQATIRHFIQDEEDFAQLVKYQPPLPRLSFPELVRAKHLIGDLGITAPWVSGAFNYMSDHRDVQSLLVDAMISPEFYRAMAEYFTDRVLRHLSQLLDEGVDVLSYAGNIASGSVVGPRFFEEYILPYERRVIQFIEARGTAVLYHNCGDARDMISVYNKLGMSAYESLTEPPYGDNDLRDALVRFDPSVTLVGNIDQISFLKEAAPEDVEKKAISILEAADGRPAFILGTSDFIEEDTPLQNLWALAKVAVSSGR